MNDFKKVSKLPVGIKYGLIIAAINIIWGLLTYLMGIGTSPGVFNSLLGLGVAIISIFLIFQGIRGVKRMQGGFLTFGGGFITGILITIAASVVYSIYMYFYLKMINPGMLEVARDRAMSGMSEEEMEQVGQYIDMFVSPGFASLSTLFIYLVGGVIISAIIAAVIKNNSPEISA